MSKSCLVIDDLNIDLILSGIKNFPEIGNEIIARDYTLNIGGSGGIFSVVLSKLGIKTYIISKIGDGFLDNFLLRKLKGYKVNTNNLIIKDKKKRRNNYNFILQKWKEPNIFS